MWHIHALQHIYISDQRFLLFPKNIELLRGGVLFLFLLVLRFFLGRADLSDELSVFHFSHLFLVLLFLRFALFFFLLKAQELWGYFRLVSCLFLLDFLHSK